MSYLAQQEGSVVEEAMAFSLSVLRASRIFQSVSPTESSAVAVTLLLSYWTGVALHRELRWDKPT